MATGFGNAPEERFFRASITGGSLNALEVFQRSAGHRTFVCGSGDHEVLDGKVFRKEKNNPVGESSIPASKKGPRGVPLHNRPAFDSL